MPKPNYNVFISWSGLRSKFVAIALRDWIPLVIQAAVPFMSETDIEKGSRSLGEIAKALDGVSLGLVCLTPENLGAGWLLYEAGAIAKAVDDTTRLCTFLLGGLRPEDVSGPLGMFQATRPEKQDTRMLMRAINRAISAPVPEKSLDQIFDGMWPELDEKLKGLPTDVTAVQTKRPSEDMIADILEIVRADHTSRKKIDWMDEYIPVFKELLPVLHLIMQNTKPADLATGQPLPSNRYELGPTRNAVHDSGMRGDEKPAQR